MSYSGSKLCPCEVAPCLNDWALFPRVMMFEPLGNAMCVYMETIQTRGNWVGECRIYLDFIDPGIQPVLLYIVWENHVVILTRFKFVGQNYV